jgi:NAD(P)-dependent dehydrogenase (short-subunit alcohol dehydrogenase family)
MMISTKFLLRKKYFRKKEDDSPGPVIINVSSLLALRSGYGTVAYSASKAGVIGFTQALANEYALHGVRVNALVPGYVETDMTKGKPSRHEMPLYLS